MKKILFICSHIFSGSDALVRSLDNTNRIQKYSSNRNIYSNAQNLIALAANKHKLNSKLAIYMDELLFNYQLSNKDLFKYCKFIYLVREPVPTIDYLNSCLNMKFQFCESHYINRLRRIYELTQYTPNALFLDWKDLFNDKLKDVIQDYLDIKDFNLDLNSLNMYSRNKEIRNISDYNFSEQYYEEFLYKIRNKRNLRLI